MPAENPGGMACRREPRPGRYDIANTIPRQILWLKAPAVSHPARTSMSSDPTDVQEDRSFNGSLFRGDRVARPGQARQSRRGLRSSWSTVARRAPLNSVTHAHQRAR